MAEPAPPSQQDSHPEVTLGVTAASESPDGADAEINCILFANKPNYSGNKITGTGGISSCSGGTPVACSSEVDLQVYLAGPGWVTSAASGRQHKCPPPARSTSATQECDPQPDSWSYRSETLGTITAGTTSSGVATSGILNVKCL
ncbi:hypothetical protein EJC51_46165 [Streptomyces aquilus]|uniref:Uncharacterized protein n=1 Tax=Streptomyces aquilus TaxID=2548456 RepID=A0A3S9IEN0_9ACTN|nr:hypothetical protein [Streptomyces aquilus]AZP22789.1 hypothetical protein EJC51_46165 [Streptomyces aquilus]